MKEMTEAERISAAMVSPKPSNEQRIAEALERIATVLEDVTDNGRLNVGGKLVTVEDRP